MSQNVETKSAEQAEKAVAAQPQAPADYTVELKGVSELNAAISKLGEIVKEKVAPVKPQALLSNTEASQKVEESKEAKEQARFEKIAKYVQNFAHAVKEDITSAGASGALGQVWQPDMIVLPTDLPANLRRFVQVKEIPRGAKQVNFTSITTPEFASLTEDTAPSDVSQTISEIQVAPAETGCKQRVSYITMESATPDVIQAVERSFQAAALIDEDNTILAALDAASGTDAGTVFAGGVSSESSLTSSDTMLGKYLNYAMSLIQQKGYSINPGDLVCVMHPVQYQGLLSDTAINQYLYFGSIGPIQQGVVPQVYGVDVVRSTRVPTGTGSGSPVPTTYHAQVFLKASFKGNVPAGLGTGGAVGLGISRDLMVETWRKIDERDIYIVASHRIAAGVIQANAAARILTC